MSRNRASRSNALVTNRLRLSRCAVGPSLCVWPCVKLKQVHTIQRRSFLCVTYTSEVL